MEGLECSVILYSDILTMNDTLRYDAEYFCKNYLNYLNVLNRKGYELINNSCFVTDGIHESIDFDDNSNINLISAKSPKENYFDLSGNGYISLKQHIANPRTTLKLNDVIISTVGTIGNVAVVDESILPANSDRHVGIIRVNKSFDPYYLSTFLLSKYGKFQSTRESTGNVQLNLFIYKIKQLKIAVASNLFQKKINNLCFISMNYRKDSKKLYQDAELKLLKELNIKKFDSPAKKNTNIKSFKESFLSTGRLDAEYYQPKYENYHHIVTHYQNGFTFIRDEFEHIIYTSSKKETGYYYIEIGDINVSDGSCQANYIETESLPANAKTIVKQGDILISNVRPNRGALSIIDTDYKNLIVSGAFTVLRTKQESHFSNELLKVLLRLPIYRDWLLQFNVGTQYPVIKDEDILNLPIPLFSDDIQHEVTIKIRQSEQLKKQSEQLLDVAKTAVEMAIEQNEEAAIDYINAHIQPELVSEGGNLH